MGDEMKKELTVFDNPRNVQRFLLFFYGCLILLLVIDPFIHKHGEFPWKMHRSSLPPMALSPVFC